MNRPGPAGLTIVLAFTIVAAIEFRTLLGMFGINIASQLYYGIATTVVASVLLALFALPENDTASAKSA
ncbi:MAG: hypothetical protein ACI8TL_000407 [Natronomonas sp.]|jgi:hypothetical protein